MKNLARVVAFAVYAVLAVLRVGRRTFRQDRPHIARVITLRQPCLDRIAERFKAYAIRHKEMS